jgi:DNA-binding MltR family transcriptional regulator
MTKPVDDFLAKQKAAFTAFRKALTAESDRGCALFAAAYLDRALSDLLFVSLVGNKNIEDDLFRGNAPLSSFSARIKMAFYLGKLSPSARRDLETIRSIRNDFAHHPEYIDFTVQSVKDRCDNLVHIWHEADARPRAKFTAAVSAALAMIHAETLRAEAPTECADVKFDEGFKVKVRTMAKESAEAMARAMSRDTSDDDA